MLTRITVNKERRSYRRTIIHYPLILLLVFTLSLSSSAQDTLRRPHIGLVLSGGGALGMSHVGILKVMEESGLRPDIITGTSMGSIIGGFYALGYSADSLHKILNAVNWDLVMSNRIPQNRIIFPEKEHFYNSILSLPLSSKKIRLPSGLISGQQIENTLSYYGWPAADINDFLKLPIPFTCMGTDLITIKKVELKTGYFPDALRASSAIPTIFSPIKIDTALLSDGGFLRNFPATEAKEMGADIIIGSYTGFQPKNEEELHEITGIIKQIGMARSFDDFEVQKKLIDYMILPDLKGISSFDFNAADSLVSRGYKAALPFKEQFRKLADSLNKIGRQLPVTNILDKQFYSFDKIELKGNNVISDGQILGVLDIETGEKVDKTNLYHKIDLLYGKAWFDKVKYRIEPRHDSLILVIDCTEKPKATFYGSVHYDNALGAGILMAFSGTNLLTQKSVIDVDSYVGQYFRIKTKLLQYIDRNNKLGLSFDFYADNTIIPKLALGGETGDVISRNIFTGLGISRFIGLNQMMNISLNIENLFLMPRYVSETNLKYLSYTYFTSIFNYRVNTLDNNHFPDKGIIMNIYAGTSDLLSGRVKEGSVRNVYRPGSSGDFSFNRFYTIRGTFTRYFTKVDRLTFSFRADALYVSDCDSVSAQNNFYMLGGLNSLNERSVPMLGFHPNEIPVKKFAGLGMEMDWEVFRDIHLNLAGNLFAAQEADRDNGYSFLTGYGVGIGYMSLIGPIKAGIMQGFYGDEKYFRKIKGYVSVGYRF